MIVAIAGWALMGGDNVGAVVACAVVSLALTLYQSSLFRGRK
jgi:hypothetical protein